ncbi:MAG: hypothetical protein C0592_06415 [Marinilabiliales bacterium]|nr:MAG: hypothetical protein C0592_06415 [Marinilabiliales bacterium]
MKNIISILAAIVGLTICTTTSKAQIPDFEWAKQMGGSSYDIGYSINTDADGNIYTTGRFSGTVDFDPGTGDSSLTSAGGTDIFVQKLDVNGDFVWVRQMSGTGNGTGYDITIDHNGNILLTGFFDGTIDFDPGAGTSNFTTVAYDDIFVEKLNSNGDFMWAKHMGSTSYDYGQSIATDINGNVYTTGNFRNTIDFDPGTGTNNLTTAGSNDIFIQKLDSNGNFVWVKQIGSTSSDIAYSITTDAYGALYTTGNFQLTVDFDPGAGISNLTEIGMGDVFILKLDTSGSLIWVRQMGGSSSESGMAISTDNMGNVLTTGTFRGTVDFDPGAGNLDLTSAGLSDIFIQKLDSSGGFLWAKQMGGTDNDFTSDITTDNDNNVFTIGHFNGHGDFNPDTGTTILYSAGYTDIFVQKLDSNGNFVWVEKMGSTDSDNGNSITIDDYNNVFSTGFFNGIVDFDPDTGTTNLTSAGSIDIFIQKLSQCSTTFGVDTIVACDSINWIDGITYYSSNTTAKDTIINVGGCDSIVTLNLTINSVSDISTTLTGLTITANNSSATYAWLDCDNSYSVIAGETNQSFTATANGNYAVELTENGCVDTSACVNINSVGLEGLNTAEKIRVYPNPAGQYITVEFATLQESATIKILSILGQEILNKEIHNAKISQIELNQPFGIYFLEVSDYQGNKTTLKIVKE